LQACPRIRDNRRRTVIHDGALAAKKNSPAAVELAESLS
jgi:hypothetical protein